MARPMRVATAVSCLTLALASSASATTYYVTPTGGGSTCSQAAPCDLPTAVGMSVNGDIVSVGAGNYTLSGSVYIDQPGVTITGTPGDGRPTITAPGAFIMGNPTNLHLRDLRITADATSNPTIQAISATIDRVDVTTSAGIFQGIAVRDLTLRDSVVRAVTGGGVGLVTANATIVGSTIIANAQPDSRGMSVYPGYFGAPAAVTRIGNSIIMGGTDSIDLSPGITSPIDLSVDYSSYTGIQNATGTGVTTHVGTHNVGAPLLVDLPGRTDIHQADGSPTINAGRPGEATSGLDFEGTPRLLGSAPDIGAHEKQVKAGALIKAADLVTDRGARLRATVTPGDLGDTQYYFQTRTTGAYGTGTTPVTLTGTQQRLVTRSMTFPSSTTVYYRVVATNSLGTTYSGETSFRTAALRPRVGSVTFGSTTIRSGRSFTTRFNLSKRARVVVVLTRLRPGRLSSGVCSLTATTGTRCTKRIRRAVLSSILSAGRPTVRTIGATPGGHPLAPGRYEIRVSPVDLVSGLIGTAQTATFTVVR